jgi:hypothetical protein
LSLELTALHGDNPVAFMAGLGLLRVAPEECRLSWQPRTQLATLHGIERDALLNHLVEHMRSRAATPELALTEKGDVRGINVAQYRDMVRDADSPTLSWIRCWWREDGDKVIPTDLCLTGGPQRYIKMAKNLAQALDPERRKGAEKKVRAHFEEALFGPWRYQDDASSWGWDPTTYRPGALTHEAPAKMKLEGVAAAYWLAWESQLFFPCLPGLGTLGFQRRPRRWNWVTWSVPLDRHATKAILREPDEAVALGGAGFQSRIINAGQYQFMMPGRAA